MLNTYTCQIGLTRVQLLPAYPMTIKLASDPYLVHQAVYRLVGDTRTENRVLYRMEVALDSYQRVVPTLLIQHGYDARINTDSLLSSCGTIETKRLTINLERYKSYRFRLRANPTKSIPSGQYGRRGTRVALKDENECHDWMKRKFGALQITLQTLECIREPVTVIRKLGTSQKSRLEIGGVLFDGIIRINNPELAIEGLVNGFGRAKGFGFGLLSLAGIS